MSVKLTPKIHQEISAYKKLLKEAKVPVEAVILFGSQVRGTAKPYSDIDLCVVSSQFGKNHHDELVALLRLTNADTSSIEPHPFHPSDLADMWNPLASEIKKFGISV
ncbi:MAG: nucleotidyltransferase domain-containing protein [bacterium]|nr:nucleotidyltransferase domain-containing protein [bacterium]